MSITLGSRRRKYCIAASAITGCSLFLVWLVHERSLARDLNSRGRLSQLWLALSNYSADCGTHCDAAVLDAHGNPLYSWRVSILPILEEADAFRTFDHDQPWNSGENRRFLINSSPLVERWFQAPCDIGASTYSTSYLAIVDHRDPVLTVTNGRNAADGVLIVEICASGVAWTEPRDLRLSDAAIVLKRIVAKQGKVHFVTSAGKTGTMTATSSLFIDSESGRLLIQ